jgi:shikimate dehydrogenase
LDGWTYERFDCQEDGLARLVGRLDASWAGLSLTMPLKRAVVPLLDAIEPTAEALGVVNTVLVSGVGKGLVLTGANTDIAGVQGALQPYVTGASPKVGVILGGGATAASALVALKQLGTERVFLAVRDVARAGWITRATHHMGITPFITKLSGPGFAQQLAKADVVVCTLPAGVADQFVPMVPSATQARVLDVVYDPPVSAFAQSFAQAGGVVIPGTDMLVHQAVEQVRLMTGCSVSPQILFDALRA